MKLLNVIAIGTTFFLPAPEAVISLQTQLIAQSNDCPASPRVGYRCYQDRNLRARTGYPGSDTNTFSYSPPEGYRIMDYRETVHSKFGEGGGVNIDFVRGGAVTNIRKTINNYNKALLERKNKAQSYAQWTMRVGGETEVIENALQENNSRLAILENSNSNVDRVNASVTVSGRCTRHVFGACVDNEGGKFEGTIRFMLQYVGTPSNISATNEALLRRIDTALQQFERAQQQQAVPPINPQQQEIWSEVGPDPDAIGWVYYQSNYGRRIRKNIYTEEEIDVP